MLRSDSFAVPIQNSVETVDEAAAVVGPGRVVVGLCRIVSYVAGPGQICHRVGAVTGMPVGVVRRLPEDPGGSTRTRCASSSGFTDELPTSLG